MSKNKRKLDSSDICSICSLIVLVTLTVAAICLIWLFVSGAALKIVLSVCAVVALAFLEEKVLAYPVCFLVEKFAKQDKSKEKHMNITLEEFMDINPLPDFIDWDEVEKVLVETRFGSNSNGEWFIFSDNWEESETTAKYGLSDSSIKALKCLTKDLHTMYCDFRICGESGNEDREAEYRFLDEWLRSKYSGLSNKVLRRICGDYRIMDR